MIKVSTKDELLALKNHKLNELAEVESENKKYIYTGSNWVKYTQEGIKLSLYEINKQATSLLTPYGAKEIKETVQKINDWTTTGKTYMLYGREIGYFTLFQKARLAVQVPDYPRLGEGIIDCLSYLGRIVEVNFEDDKVELWVKLKDNDTTCLYLFDYTEGVVYYG